MEQSTETKFVSGLETKEHEVSIIQKKNLTSKHRWDVDRSDRRVKKVVMHE